MPGIVSTGDHATNTQVLLPAEALRPVQQVIAPPRLANLPGHAHLFVGREDELAALHTRLHGAGSATETAGG
ncbi:hypothetical protein C1I98_17085, partial [Spongiactinospora gelatinilytica]